MLIMKRDTLLFLIATIIFGTNGLISRFINVSSFFLVACRGIIASIFIYLVLRLQKKRINWDSIKANRNRLLLSGLSLGFMWIFLYTGYLYSVSITCLLNNMAPIFVVIISTIIYKERLNTKQIICIIFVLFGVLMVSGIFENKLVASIYSFIFGFLSLVFFCINILINKKMKNIEPIDRTLVQMFLSFLVSIIVTIFTSQIPSQIDTTSVVLIILLGIFNTGLAYVLYYDAISNLPAYKIAIIGYLEPVISIILSVCILHENMTVFSVIGSIIIIVSTCISELIENSN